MNYMMKSLDQRQMTLIFQPTVEFAVHCNGQFCKVQLESVPIMKSLIAPIKVIKCL